MLRLIHGDNYYQSSLDLEQLKLSGQDKEVSVVDGDMIQDAAEVFVNNESYGLFNSSNLTIVKRFFKNPKKISLEKKIIEKLEKSNAENMHLVFWEDHNVFSSSKKKSKPKAKAKKPRATSKLNTYLKNNAEVKQNEKLTVPQLMSWLKEEISASKMKISEKTVSDLINRVGQDQFLLSNELDKLKLWSSANNGEAITSAVLESVTILYEQDYKIWDFTDAFFSKNKIKALRVLHRLMVNPQQDFPMIIGSVLRQLKIIYLVKKYSSDPRTVMSKLRLMPFMFSKAQNIARAFSLKELKFINQKFIDLDHSIKLGKIDVKLGLDLLITTLS